MTTQQQYILQLKELVIKKFGREITSAEEYIALAEAIGIATDNELNITALSKIFSNEQNNNYAPRPAILSAMARYVGYSGWSDFCTSPNILPTIETNVIPVNRRWGVIIVTLFAILVVATTVIYLLFGGDNAKDAQEPNISLVVKPIAEEWMARTLEECNTVRYYAEHRNYEEQVESFIEEYEASLLELIVSDIESHLSEQDLHYSDELIMAEAEDIADRCRAIYNCL